MIQPWKKGEAITARRLNESVDQGNAVALRVLRPSRRNDPSPNAVPFPVTVVSVHADYMVCRPLNITNANADIYVAKPWELRTEPFDTETIPNKDGTLLSYAYDETDKQLRTVTNTEDSSTEEQVIVPAYVPRQIINEVEYPGTEITVQRVAFGPNVSFPGSGNMLVEVEFEDMNRAGRAWAEKNE